MKEGHLRVRLTKVRPNPWNPNVMDERQYAKLKLNLQQTLTESKKLPPIIVRPREKEKKYEIIDGFHRWRALQELGEARVSAFSMRVNDRAARLLTVNLNYLRGSPDRVKYARNIVSMIELGAPLEDLEKLLPETPDELDSLLGEAEFTLEAFQMLGEDDGDEEVDDDGVSGMRDPWIDVNFRVSVAQAKVIEMELSRIAKALKGKAKRARALEFMAVQSSQSVLPEELA